MPPGVSAKAMLNALGNERVRGKAIAKFGKDAVNESVASTLDGVFGWNLVPKTPLRTVHIYWDKYGDPVTPPGPHQKGIEQQASVQEWVKNSTTLGAWGGMERFLKEAPDPSGQLMKMAIFDIIIGNTDRHEWNILVQRGKRLWAIDHAYAFTYRNDGNPHFGIGGASDAVRAVHGLRIPRRLLDDLDVDEGDVRAALAPLNNAKQIDAVVWRWKRIREYGRIPDYGEEREFWGDKYPFGKN